MLRRGAGSADVTNSLLNRGQAPPTVYRALEIDRAGAEISLSIHPQLKNIITIIITIVLYYIILYIYCAPVKKNKII